MCFTLPVFVDRRPHGAGTAVQLLFRLLLQLWCYCASCLALLLLCCYHGMVCCLCTHSGGFSCLGCSAMVSAGHKSLPLSKQFQNLGLCQFWPQSASNFRVNVVSWQAQPYNYKDRSEALQCTWLLLALITKPMCDHE